jgi:hypothetical protein
MDYVVLDVLPLTHKERHLQQIIRLPIELVREIYQYSGTPWSSHRYMSSSTYYSKVVVHFCFAFFLLLGNCWPIYMVFALTMIFDHTTEFWLILTATFMGTILCLACSVTCSKSRQAIVEDDCCPND